MLSVWASAVSGSLCQGWCWAEATASGTILPFISAPTPTPNTGLWNGDETSLEQLKEGPFPALLCRCLELPLVQRCHSLGTASLHNILQGFQVGITHLCALETADIDGQVPASFNAHMHAYGICVGRSEAPHPWQFCLPSPLLPLPNIRGPIKCSVGVKLINHQYCVIPGGSTTPLSRSKSCFGQWGLRSGKFIFDCILTETSYVHLCGCNMGGLNV